jgi:mono/diheme cytochrome c family protein
MMPAVRMQLMERMERTKRLDWRRDWRVGTLGGRWICAFLICICLCALCLALAALAGCDVERRKSDAELGLNPQQATGRKIYDNYCDRCHSPDSTKGKKGPGLKGLFQHQYLSQTGLPANDERVTDIIRNGRPDMTGYSQVLSAQDMQDLLAYLHTL